MSLVSYLVNCRYLVNISSMLTSDILSEEEPRGGTVGGKGKPPTRGPHTRNGAIQPLKFSEPQFHNLQNWEAR